MLKINDVIEVKKINVISEKHEDIYNLLKGKKLKISKISKGKYNCVCGANSKKDNSNFIEVISEKGNKLCFSKGCCKIFFNIDIKDDSKKNYIERLKNF